MKFRVNRMKTIFWLLLLPLSACMTPNRGFVDENHNVIPVRPRFTLEWRPDQAVGHLQFNRFYVYEGERSIYPNSTEAHWFSFVFFDCGRVFFKSESGLFGERNVEADHQRGRIGFYSVDHEKLVVELFVPIYGDRYHKYFGEIFKDSIVFDRGEHGRFPVDRRPFHKTVHLSEEAANFEPYWER